MGLTDKAKEAEGKLTGDEEREAQGKAEQAKGEAKDAIEHAKNAASKISES